MILRELEFAFEGVDPSIRGKNEPAFRMKINHIIDSIYYRMPKKLKTETVIKLVCRATVPPVEREYFSLEGVGEIFIPCPHAEEMLFLSEEEAPERVIQILKEGVKLTANHDTGINDNASELLDLIEDSREPFDYFRKNIKRSHRSRKYKCEGVVRIKQSCYESDVLISDKLGNFERINITNIEPGAWYSDLGYNRLIWDGDYVVGLTDDKERFRFTSKLIGN